MALTIPERDHDRSHVPVSDDELVAGC